MEASEVGQHLLDGKACALGKYVVVPWKDAFLGVYPQHKDKGRRDKVEFFYDPGDAEDWLLEKGSNFTEAVARAFGREPKIKVYAAPRTDNEFLLIREAQSMGEQNARRQNPRRNPAPAAKRRPNPTRRAAASKRRR